MTSPRPPGPVTDNADLQALGEWLSGRADQLVEQWHDDVQRSVVTPWCAAIERAETEHRRAVEQLLPGDVGPTWKDLDTYRSRLLDHVLAPLAAEHARIRSAGRTVGYLDRLRALLAEVGTDIPALCDIPDPTERYDALPEDDLRAQGWKMWIRISRRITNLIRRMTGRYARAGEYVRRLSPRALWHTHVDQRFTAFLFLRHEAMQLALARPWQQVLSKAGHAVDTVLTVEQQYDRLIHHLPPDASPSESEPDTLPKEAVETVRQAVRLLQDALGEAGRVSLPALDRNDPGHTVFQRSLELAGTPLLPGAWRARTRSSAWPTRLRVRGEEWMDWEQNGQAELQMELALLQFRGEVIRLETDLLDRLYRQTIRPLTERSTRIGVLLREAESRVTSMADEEVQGVQVKLRAIGSEVVRSVEGAVDLAGLSLAEHALANLGEGEGRRIEAFIRGLPDEVGQVGASVEDEVEPAATPIPWSPRDVARDAYQHPLAARVGKFGIRFRNRIVEAWATAHEVPQIVEFSCEAALDELTVPADGEVTPERVRHAREVAGDGFRRAADTLDQVVGRLGEPWEELATTIFQAFAEDWEDFHRRVQRATEEQARWKGINSSTRAFWRRWHLARHWIRVFNQSLLSTTQKTRHWLAQLISRGQAVVGATKPTEEAWRFTLEQIDQAEAVLRALPLVYRRLFSYAPTVRQQLLVGRETELRKAMAHVQQWLADEPTGVLLVEGLPGVGRTSFLYVLAEMLDRPEVHYLTLDHRCSADQFAKMIAESRGWAGETLSELETTIRAIDPDEGGIMLIDDLEFLFHHVVGGADAVEQVLGFFSRTERQVCWITTFNAVLAPMLRSELQFVARAFRSIVLAPLERDEMENALLRRHRWSGRELQFLPPSNPGLLFRRRLAQAGSTEDAQKMLRELWFDRVDHLADGDPAQAILCWLRSVEFEAEEESRQGLMLLRPCTALDIRFLSDLSVIHSMSLRSLLAHLCLTSGDLAAVLNIPGSRAMLILEHLLNLRIIEPFPAPTVDAAAAIVLDEVPYSVRPALRKHVLDHLRGMNMLPRRAP